MCEMAKVYDESLVVARKPHKCCECRREITKGESHMKCSGLWDGWATFRQHLHCYHFSRWINHGNNNGVPSGVEQCYVPSCEFYSSFRDWRGEAEPLVKFNLETSTRRYEGGNDECIAFGDVRASLCDIDDDLVRLWDAMISGANEFFGDGSGI